MSELTELESWKADAIRLLGEKVKAEKERDALLVVVKDLLTSALCWKQETGLGSDRIIRANKLIAEIERG